MEKTLGAARFSDAYKHSCFLEWYQLGQPPIAEYWLRMSKAPDGRRPSKNVLHGWVKTDGWFDKAADLDAQVESGIIENTVAEKVEMLRRHATTAREVQNLAFNYLQEHKEELTPNAAVRLLQLGVEIERQSVGVPQALEKVSKLDDEAILSGIKSIISGSEVTIEQIEAEIQSE